LASCRPGDSSSAGETERARIVDSFDVAIAQVGLDERPADRLRHGEEPLRCFRRSGGDGCANGLWAAPRFGARQAQKASRLLGDIGEIDKPAARWRIMIRRET
jgi:hypothetical protein